MQEKVDKNPFFLSYLETQHTQQSTKEFHKGSSALEYEYSKLRLHKAYNSWEVTCSDWKSFILFLDVLGLVAVAPQQGKISSPWV